MSYDTTGVEWDRPHHASPHRARVRWFSHCAITAGNWPGSPADGARDAASRRSATSVSTTSRRSSSPNSSAVSPTTPESPSARRCPYVLGFAGVLLLAEVLWRVGLHCLNRLDARGIEHLYVIGMDELFAKDAAFFHDNFAGSLTKRVLSFASRFEEFVDTLTFSVVGRFVPLVFGAVVLWRYAPAARRRAPGDDRADRAVRRAP